MNAETFFKHFETFAEAPNGVAKLREMILQLAVQGKLVPQDPNDEPATALSNDSNLQCTPANEKHSGKSQRPGASETGKRQDTPNGWAQVRLEDVANIIMGNSPPGSSYNEHGIGTPLINGPVEFSKRPFGLTVRSKFTSEPTKLCKQGDLLICVRGSTTGRTNIAAFDACIGRGVASIQAGKSQLYVNLFILSLRQSILDMGVGSTFPSISASQIASLPLKLPPLAEQTRIVSKVDQLMNLCDELESRQTARRESRMRLVGATLDRVVSTSSTAEFPKHVNRLRDQFDRLFDTPTTIPQLRQTILQLAVQGKLVPQDPNDEPASDLIDDIAKKKCELIRQLLIPKESNLPAITENDSPFAVPTGWKWIRLETICEVITKGSSPIWQGVQYVDAALGVLFVTSENVGNYVLRKMDEPKFVERRFNEMEPRSILQKNDLLVNLVGGSIGRCAIYDRDDVANINQAVGIIRLVRGAIAIDRYYLLHYLNSPSSLKIMFSEQVETARANLSLTNMKHFFVPLPPLAEQKRIVSKVDQLMKLCDELESKMAESEIQSTQLLSAGVHHLLNASSTV